MAVINRIVSLWFFCEFVTYFTHVVCEEQNRSVEVLTVAADYFLSDDTASSHTIPTSDNWALYCNDHGKRSFSQSNQDGIIEYIFQNVGTTNKYFVEFGFNSPYYEVGSGSNTYQLYAHQGWNGLLLDGDFENETINLHKEWIMDTNINELFDKYNVPLEFDYLSIDLDSTDLWILRAILSHRKYKPRVISVEYNSHLNMNSYLTVLNTTRWDSYRIYGASFGAIQMVAREFGYSVVAVVKYLDLFLVRNDLLSGSSLPVFTKDQVEGPNHPPSKDFDLVVSNIMDYSVWYHSNFNVSYAQHMAITSKSRDWEHIYKVFLSLPIYIHDRDLNLVFNYSFAPGKSVQNPTEAHQHFSQTILAFCSLHQLTNYQCNSIRNGVRYVKTSSTFQPDHPMYHSIVTKVYDINDVPLPDFQFQFTKYLVIENSFLNILYDVNYTDARRDFEVQVQEYCRDHMFPLESCVVLRDHMAAKSGTLLLSNQSFDKEIFFEVMRTNMVL